MIPRPFFFKEHDPRIFYDGVGRIFNDMDPALERLAAEDGRRQPMVEDVKVES